MEILILLIETRNTLQSLNLSPSKNTLGRGFFLFPSPLKKKSAFCLTRHNSGGYFQLKVFLQ